MAQAFKQTLNLPKTAFPMRGDLARREPKRWEHWTKQNLYETLQEQNAEKPDFILHDGPPYANGHIHIGHALNKVLKDIILRYKSMRGYRTPYVPGWDCHGLPIEQRVIKKLGSKVNDMPPVEVRKLCEETAQNFVGIQREEFQRLGILGAWDSPYLTFNPQYEVGILSVLRDLAARGLVRKGFRVVHWDTVYRTALAEAEIEYAEHTSHSIYVKFPLVNTDAYEPLKGLANVSIVIWTTTPWTLPANLGISLHPTFEYVALKHGDQHYVVAAELAEAFCKGCKIEPESVEEVARFTADCLDRAECKHPIFPEKTSLVMLGDHVTLEQGTGCVHTAPGHGAEDFHIGQKYGLPVLVPVNDRGCYTSDFPEMEGQHVFKCNEPIVEKLKAEGTLVGHGTVKHEYPHSWRSKEPIIFRATEQWFMELEEEGNNVREESLKAIKEVQWIPKWGEARITGMVSNRPDWCLSRQRSWGVPIPSIRSKKTGESILDLRILEKFIEIVAEKGTNAWYEMPLAAFIPEGFVYEPTGESSPDDFERENDILDVWFDSGASHVACLEQDERLSSPADLYLEGSDQHRGWFQAALLTSVGTRDRAPYKAVLTHGFLLDGEGKAMSKSLGNTVAPQEIVGKLGADNLRLWVTSVDFFQDARVSEEILKRITDTYRNVRNQLRFQISNLYDFDPASDAVPLTELSPIDSWALHATAEFVEAATKAYEAYEFHRVYQLLNTYCSNTLSSTYHDILKDRLYTFAAKSHGRRSAQTVISIAFDALNKILAPILVYTADEAWSFAEGNEEYREGSVHLEGWPEVTDDWRNPEHFAAMELALKYRDSVNEKLEALRKAEKIGKSLDGAVTIHAKAGSAELEALKAIEDYLPEVFIVSYVTILEDSEELCFEAHVAEGERCPRCWRVVKALEPTEHGEVCPRCAEAINTLQPAS